MKNQTEKTLIERAGRKPLYVQVVMDPPLHGCWSVNVSATGLGLVAPAAPPTEGPREGQEVGLEFTLPGAGRIRVAGEVRWRHDGPAGGVGATSSLGISFKRFDGNDQVRLARYLLSYQLVVSVAFAQRDQEAEIRAALDEQATLLFAPSAGELREDLGRGDVSALIVCGEPRLAFSVIDELSASPGAGTSTSQLQDLGSRVVLCAPLAPAEVIALFNARRLHHAMAPPLDREALRAAVLSACREHGVRVEQERMSLELERNLLRERARTEPPATTAAKTALPAMESRAMRRVMDLVRVAAPHKVAVLLQGETGTGKEVLARAVHELSPRSRAPFVVQDCGALTETLLESELFGHVKGAFTGAVADHPGLFVLANSGTVFLDEIENTSANFQAKLLRVIENGEVRPVGGAQVRQVDVRLIAASNRDLAEEVRAGRFRNDLYFRLNTFTVNLPALRERGRDVLDLARHFVEVFNHRLDRRCPGFTPEAEEVLLGFEWPGNVRELRNVIERAVLLCSGGEPISPAHLPEALVARSRVRPIGPAVGSLRDRLDRYERELIREALERHRNVLRRAAAELKTDPVTFGRKARRHGLWS